MRPGRSVELVEATLAEAEGEPLLRAVAWRLRSAEVGSRKAVTSERGAGSVDGEAVDAAPGPRARRSRLWRRNATSSKRATTSATTRRWTIASSPGRFLAAQGPATVWMRMRQPLVAGEQPSPLQRLLVAADSGNGVSATLDWARFVFINVDLSVHLNRMPAGEPGPIACSRCICTPVRCRASSRSPWTT